MKSLLARVEKLERAKAAADELRRQESTPITLHPVLSRDEWMAWHAALERVGGQATMDMARMIVAARGTPAWAQFMAGQSLDWLAP
jgi:hypothetical protein